MDFFRTGLEGTYGPFSGGMGQCPLMKRMIIDDSCSDYSHNDADDIDISFFVNAQHIEFWCLLHSSDDFDLLVNIVNLFQGWAPMD